MRGQDCTLPRRAMASSPAPPSPSVISLSPLVHQRRLRAHRCRGRQAGPLHQTTHKQGYYTLGRAGKRTGETLASRSLPPAVSTACLDLQRQCKCVVTVVWEVIVRATNRVAGIRACIIVRAHPKSGGRTSSKVKTLDSNCPLHSEGRPGRRIIPDLGCRKRRTSCLPCRTRIAATCLRPAQPPSSVW